MKELMEQAQFIEQYFPIAAQSNNDFVRVALSIQAMIVALDLVDGDMIISNRGLAIDVGTSTIARGMRYATEVLKVTVSSSGKRVIVAEGGRKKARQNVFEQMRDVDIMCAIQRAKILEFDLSELCEAVEEKWREMND